MLVLVTFLPRYRTSTNFIDVHCANNLPTIDSQRLQSKVDITAIFSYLWLGPLTQAGQDLPLCPDQDTDTWTEDEHWPGFKTMELKAILTHFVKIPGIFGTREFVGWLRPQITTGTDFASFAFTIPILGNPHHFATAGWRSDDTTWLWLWLWRLWLWWLWWLCWLWWLRLLWRQLPVPVGKDPTSFTYETTGEPLL